MTESDAFFLGIIQGLTEFLPVSSSGHLEVFRSILDANMLGKENLLFTSILHFATALSTIVVFRKDIFDLIFNVKRNQNRIYILKILIAIFPAGLVGFFFSNHIEKLFVGNLKLVGIMLIITGLMLLLTKISRRKNLKISYFDSLIIGISQALAIIPGISRSGTTICTSLYLGKEKNESAKFSFLIVIPVIFGAILKDILSGDFFHYDIEISVLLIGFFSALISGFIACKWMLNIVKNNNLMYFSFYCFLLGLTAIFFI
tara:strand:+ start:331 stop:1107 length:777 start_codon:yes stop_codon:yes gene_type:complete